MDPITTALLITGLVLILAIEKHSSVDFLGGFEGRKLGKLNLRFRSKK